MKEKKYAVLLATFVASLFLASIFAAGASAVQGRFISAGRGVNNNLQSLNWGGYVVASNQTALNDYNVTYAKPDVTQVNASWIVQTASPSHQATYSAQWVGIGGFFSGDNSLIQTGTESDYSHGASYGAWYELLPAAETPISMTVKPGDHMYASISLVPGTTNQWKIVLKDITENEQFTTTVTYSSSKLSGEYIEERPELCTAVSCSLSTLANFGTAYYGKGYTGVNDTNIATIANTSAYIGNLPYTNITMVSSTGSVLAAPSALTYNGSSFTMTYKGSSSSVSTHGHKSGKNHGNNSEISIVH
ncbi:MAG: hypothetical protein QW207_03655 [Candidatus Micrarchaeaceae archaeon]